MRNLSITEKLMNIIGMRVVTLDIEDISMIYTQTNFMVMKDPLTMMKKRVMMRKIVVMTMTMTMITH
jgi:hypothetical protein